MENNNVDLESASSRIKGANVFVGLTEAYHESLCLLHHFVHEALPEAGCDCTKVSEWYEQNIFLTRMTVSYALIINPIINFKRNLTQVGVRT